MSPHDFRVIYSEVRGAWIIVDAFGVWVDEQEYLREDDAAAAISTMLDEYEQEVRERRRDEDEAEYRGSKFGASYGANSAGRS